MEERVNPLLQLLLSVMASGCIVGECPVCKELVFEDEWSGLAYERYNKFIHIGQCHQRYKKAGELLEENRLLRMELAEIRKWFK
ncbi:MAG: hypothetical protein K0S80_3563 [Neobacillus sp.]|nr:hypothetical protein [Neobacillus sp.]